MRLYLDACTIIYAVEGEPTFRVSVLSHLSRALSENGSLALTSALSRLECRVKPLKDANNALLKTYEDFFQHPRVVLADVSHAVIEEATVIRAKYGFRTPDAIHLATAIQNRADLFLTNDVALKRCTEITVQTL